MIATDYELEPYWWGQAEASKKGVGGRRGTGGSRGGGGGLNETAGGEDLGQKYIG